MQKILVAIACHAGAVLGAQRFSRHYSPPRAFLGFNNFLGHPVRSPSRANDAYVQALNDLLAGATLRDVARNLNDNLLQAAKDYLMNRNRYRLAGGDAMIIVLSLHASLFALVCLGDTGATL
ncbi:hypothetical protein GCM10022419_045520 [Nonomuraea rosea]|uniref:Uncharacterized protein n=1 Tax=Nonomuraea rosea TaxID=638574 RepID=A0ABP6X3L2_9ACTN